jgi:hypothetical protein
MSARKREPIDPPRRRVLRLLALAGTGLAVAALALQWTPSAAGGVALAAAAQTPPGECALFTDCGTADDGECNRTLLLRPDGRIEGRVQACLGAREGTRIELVQGERRVDFFDATCDPNVLPSCYIPDECTVCGTVGQGSNQFPGAEGFQPGPAKLVASWDGGGCEAEIELVTACDS